jgi:Ca-activated chloride channel family protein
MTFGAQQYLYALILLPALIVFIRWAAGRRAAAVSRIGDPTLVERLSMAVNYRTRRWRVILWFVGITLIILSLARPQWGSEVEIVEQRGVQVMVALDVSRSMLAEDMKPTRLDRAKLEISDMMSRLNGDEIGIVLFSGASFIQFPLTFDYATARTYLQHANTNVITRQGTVIAEAIDTAMAGFSEQRATQKVIVIMTDGENHEGDPIGVARQAVEDGAIIYTVGFGSAQGEPIPEYDEQGSVTGFREDGQGNVVLSQLDETTLQQIARAGGGRYFRASERDAIEALVAEIESLQDESFQSEFSRTRIERFQIFLLAGVISLVLGEMMSDRLSIPLRRRRTIVTEAVGNV